MTNVKIKNGAVTSKKIKLSSLGTVPSATFAKTAGSADNVKTWFTTASVGQTVTLLTVGPFTSTGDCTGTTGDPNAETEVTTSQANSYYNSYEGGSEDPFNPSSGAEQVGETESGLGGWSGPYDGTDAAISGDGNTIVDTATDIGTGIDGADCVFGGYAVVLTR